MRFNKSIALLLLTNLFGACQSTDPNTPTPVTQINDPFLMIEHLQKMSEPFSMFAQAYPTFSFQSSARLEEKNADGKSFSQTDSSNLYEQQGSKYYHLLRNPLPPVPSVEIIYDQGLIFLRPHLEKTFYQIKKNPELTDLKKTILMEVLHFFDFQKLKTSPQTKKEDLDCYASDVQEICFDPNTKLPIKGSTASDQSQGGYISLNFHISIEKEEIEMIKPEKIHSLRNHSDF